MIHLHVGECDIDILPIIKGLESEASKVDEAYGNYEAYAVALGIEEVEAVKRRAEIEGPAELSELDMVYIHRLLEIGHVQTPTPAYCQLIDLCSRDSKGVIPLDMNDDLFTDVFMDCVKATEFVKEHRLAKKGMKVKLDTSSPEAFVMGWDKFVHKVKGYRLISERREEYIANQLIDIAKYRKNVLALIEYERVEGIVKKIGK